MSKIIIELPEDRIGKINILQQELSKYKKEQLVKSTQRQLKNLFQEEDIRDKIKKYNLLIPSYVSADFHSEYDDEGGYDKRLDNFTLYDENMNNITNTYEDASWQEKSSYGDRVYTRSVYGYVRDGVSDVINEDAEEIYEYLGDDYEFDVR